MLEQAIPYILMIVGIAGFELAGRRVWWAWYVNIANQGLWLFFALLTGYWGFVVGTIFYTYQFTRNAIKWTRERHILNKPEDVYHTVGRVRSYSVEFGHPARIDVESIGMYPDNVPQMGTKLYRKAGEQPAEPEYNLNEFWVGRPT
jgi:hypothetical protein